MLPLIFLCFNDILAKIESIIPLELMYSFTKAKMLKETAKTAIATKAVLKAKTFSTG